jgi:hypothetical protein
MVRSQNDVPGLKRVTPSMTRNKEGYELSVHKFFTQDGVDLRELSAYLDGLGPGSRIRAARELTAREQAILFEAAQGFRPLTVHDFVPESVPPMTQVIHYGRNSLPVFRIFEKRFCRPEGEFASAHLWGYNEQPFKTFTGPGYFTARQANKQEVVIDYLQVPPYRPDGWPPILPNSARLSRFVYYQTRDYMRGVSRHLSVGRATRNEKNLDNWFVLCRQEL